MVEAGAILYDEESAQLLHLKRLYSHRLAKDMVVINHISTLKEIVVDLENMELKYNIEEDLGLILLYSFPSSYSNFRDTILYSHDTLTL